MTVVSRTFPRAKMVSTAGGMRRILKQQPRVTKYIRQAVESGVYRTSSELEAVRKQRAAASDDLRTVMRRFRQDIVRGSSVQDYPTEYLLLMQHPPFPDPPRTPLKLLRKKAAKPNPVAKLVKQNMRRQEAEERKLKGKYYGDGMGEAADGLDDDHGDANGKNGKDGMPQTTEEYYRRLLGVAPPRTSTAMGQKTAAVQKAYAAAVKQYQLQRTEGLSEEDALAQVDALLAQEDIKERTVSRKRTTQMKTFRQQHPGTSARELLLRDKERQRAAKKAAAASTPRFAAGDNTNADAETGASTTGDTTTSSLASIFSASPRDVEAMMRWSERLQAVPYQQWTVGASTALDHWIARRLLDLSEETWQNLLEGDDPSLLRRGRDIVAVRETLFPETSLEDGSVEEAANIQAATEEAILEASGDGEGPSDGANVADSGEKTVEELLEALRGLNTNTSSTSSTADKKAGDDDGREGSKMWDWLGKDTADGSGGGDSLDDATVDRLVDELQNWRQQVVDHGPFSDWPEKQQTSFDKWLRDQYLPLLLSSEGANDYRGRRVDLAATRDMLLAAPPESRDDAGAFWGPLDDSSNDSINEADTAEALLDRLVQDGPPAGAAHLLQAAFWDLSRSDQLERLANLGALRPVLDEYTKTADRNVFLRRHGDALLAGCPLEHLVPDPDGPIRAADLGDAAAAAVQDVLRGQRRRNRNANDDGGGSGPVPDNELRFRLEMRPYLSSADGQWSADVQTRALFQAWNQHKAGRARYEEELFRTGRLGLRYSDPTDEDKEQAEVRKYKSK